MVYGSDATTSASLRLPDGHMTTSADSYLPIVNGAFIGGDSRAAENPDLTAITRYSCANITTRSTNSKQQHHSWSGDQLYQQARAIVTAEIENITYTEFLPHLLGPNAITAYTGYNSSRRSAHIAGIRRCCIPLRPLHRLWHGEQARQSGDKLRPQSLADAFFERRTQVAPNGGSRCAAARHR